MGRLPTCTLRQFQRSVTRQILQLEPLASTSAICSTSALLDFSVKRPNTAGFSSSTERHWGQPWAGVPGALDLRGGFSAYGLREYSSSPPKSPQAVATRRLDAAAERRKREAKRASQQSAAAGDGALVPPPPQPAPTPQELGPEGAVEPNTEPASDLQIASVVNHPALIVTRKVEWGNVILGFEQQNRYTVFDQDGNVVALMAEDSGGMGTAIGRQVLRKRRSFTATVLSADGSQVIFRVRRPAYLISSKLVVEDAAGNEIGEVQQRWNLLKRNYELYLGRKQYAAISGQFLAWEFELKDVSGGTLALIDRNWSGFAKELFTDAGQYVIHFGYQPAEAAGMQESTLRIRSGKEDVKVTPMALARTDVAVIPTTSGTQLAVARPLQLSERMIALAAAISIDFNYFSQHSSGSGLLSPPLFMPMPFPGGGAEAGGEAGAGAGGEAGAGAGGEGATAAGGLEQDLGGDAFPGGQDQGLGTGSEGGWGQQGGDVGGGGGGDGGWQWDSGDSGATGGGDGEGGGGILSSLWDLINDD